MQTKGQEMLKVILDPLNTSLRIVMIVLCGVGVFFSGILSDDLMLEVLLAAVLLILGFELELRIQKKHLDQLRVKVFGRTNKQKNDE